MANKNLLSVYKKLYEKDFDYGSFDQRLEMQKGIYLLQDMGVPVGSYGFRWYQHGPYSQSLQDDMYYEKGQNYENVQFSKEHAGRIEQLHNVIKDSRRGTYIVSYWVECLASLHYLRENVLSFSSSTEEVVGELEKRKPYLSNREINLAAFDLVEGLFV